MSLESSDDIARTRRFWIASKPGETAAPAYVPDPPPWLQAGAALTLALAVQSTLAPYLAWRGATPSLVLLVVAWYGVRTGGLRGFTFGLLAGACEDALAGSTGVAWTFSTALAGLLAGRVARTWLADLQVVLVPGIAALTLFRYAAFVIALQMEGRTLGLPEAHLHVVLWQAALDAGVALILLRCVPSLGGGRAHGR
jgi:rod shape-determining protein MreD